MNAVSPLAANFWCWIALGAYWFIAANFVNKTQSSEQPWKRLVYGIPMYAAFYLVFSRHRYYFLWGEVYETGWNHAIVYVGFAFTLAGMAVAVWARVHLGRYWSGNITFKEGHRVITTGPYHFVRHPIYTGWLLGLLGSALIAGTADGFLGVELMALGFVIKLHWEERLLIGELGEEYRQYIKKVPAAIVPWISSIGAGATPTIESEAFNRAAFRSDRYRSYGLLCVCAAFMVLGLVSMAVSPGDVHFFVHGLVFWAALAMYEVILLALTAQAQWLSQPVRPWVWAINTAMECFLPTLVLLALTASKNYGPYRALVSTAVPIYFLFIVLSILRLSPALCILSGLSSAAGYVAIYLFTLHVAPNNHNRHFMPERTYFTYPLLLLGAGLIAAAVAREIRQHVIAALTEAQTRRKLDRIEYDLNVARSIQMGLLPKTAPSIAGYDIAGFSRPADQTGGDYYDWLELPGGVLFTIADAAGHGIGPALLVAACRSYFRALAGADETPERIMAKLNKLISPDVPSGRFITAAIGRLDPARHRLSLYSAGHAPLFLYVAASGQVESLDADEPPLGAGSSGEAGQGRTIELHPGDTLVLVTDGFFECRSAAGEMLGPDRLADSIGRLHALPGEELIRRLHQAVLEFSQGTAQLDDETAVVIRRRAD